MNTAVLLIAGLVLIGAEKAEPAPAKKYSLDVSKTTHEVKSGQSGLFHLLIQAAEGYKISTEAPLKIGLGGEGLKLHKTELKAADAKDQKATSPEFGVKFAAAESGDKAITVDASFFVCDAKICERQVEKISVPVSVKP